MKIGIIEVCERNHYTAALALAKTYAIDAKNEVVIFTLDSFLHLFWEQNPGISIITKKQTQSMSAFLHEIASLNFDRIHINTLSDFYKEFATTAWPENIYFTVHNTELFYGNLLINRMRLLSAGLRESIFRKGLKNKLQPLILFIKDFKRQAYRYHFIEQISKKPYKIIVYSKSQQRHLFKYVPPENTLAFPFCLHDNMQDLSVPGEKIRLCIPGSVSNKRRDYSGLFKMMAEHIDLFKNGIEIDLLGYIPADDRYLVSRIEALKAAGAVVYYNLDFISTEEFDLRLSKSDVVLGNLRVNLNPGQKYSETKETGVIFNVIKAGKPGIFPSEYQVDEELKNICLFYTSNNDLFCIIEHLAGNRGVLSALKALAKEKVKQYEPEALYHTLVN